MSFTVHDNQGAVLSSHGCILDALDAMREHSRGAEVRRVSDRAVMGYVGVVRRDAAADEGGIGAWATRWKRRRVA